MFVRTVKGAPAVCGEGTPTEAVVSVGTYDDAGRVMLRIMEPRLRNVLALAAMEPAAAEALADAIREAAAAARQ